MWRIYKRMNKQKFQNARQAMIDSQIHPMGVMSETLLEAFDIVPRERFVPEEIQGVSYCDEDIDIGGGRYLMEPSVLARLIEAANLQKDHVVLTVGSGAGYSAAILSLLVSTVVALEKEDIFINQAQAVWDDLGYCNIVGLSGELTQGAPKAAPYDFIIFNGAVSSVPEAIKAQLKIGGSIFALIKTAQQTVAKATGIKHIKEGVFSDHVLFDAGTPYLQGFEPKKEFVF